MEIDGIKVVSFVPGRVRLKVQRLKHAPRFASRVEALVSKVPGIEKVEANPLTGSVLINYDVDTLSFYAREHLDALETALRQLFPDKDLGALRKSLAQKGIVH